MGTYGTIVIVYPMDFEVLYFQKKNIIQDGAPTVLSWFINPYNPHEYYNYIYHKP